MEGTASTASTSSSEGSIIIQKRGTMRIENPFTIKVGQVFTGFGVGCGLGIGVGRPLNLGIKFFLFLSSNIGKFSFFGSFWEYGFGRFLQAEKWGKPTKERLSEIQ